MVRLIIILFLLSLISCKNESNVVHVKQYWVSFDSLHLVSYADTIIADLVVKSADKDDWWIEKCMHQLRRKDFVDTIFNEIYNQRLIAYDYYTKNPFR